MGHYTEVDPAAFERMLTEKGFKRTVQKNEVVYVRQHHVNPFVFIKVYTSIADSMDAARGCGRDAIRVVAAFEKEAPIPGKFGTQIRSFGIYKCPRVYRTTSTESVLARVYTRMREAYQAANEWVKAHPEKRR